MSAFAESRSVAYSVDSAGQTGRVACQAVRGAVTQAGRIALAIVVRNETDNDAQMHVFVPGTSRKSRRTIVQSVVDARSDFTTSVELDVARYDGMPDVHIELTGNDIEAALIVPASDNGVRATSLHDTTGGFALPVLAEPGGQHNTAHSSAGAALVVPYVRPQRARSPHDTTASQRASQPHASSGESIAVRTIPQSPAAGVMFTVFIALIGAIGVAVFRPQVPVLRVPERAKAASPVAISYRATGIGNVVYRVVGPNAELVRSGDLTTGSGSFALTFPKDHEERAYLVRVNLSGPLGIASAENYVHVPASVPVSLAPRPHVRITNAPQPPQIRSLALDRAQLNGGDTLNVYYDVAATSGNIALIDGASQIAYGTSPLSSSGHTAFVIPAVDTQRFLSVVLTAQRGSATTQSRVAVTAAPRASPSPQLIQGNDVGTVPGDTVTAPVVIAPKMVRSGAAIPVTIRDAPAGFTLVLKDNDGTELARRNVAVGSAQTQTTFTAPIVTTSSTVRLEASYAQGSGSETTVQTINVRPG